MKGLKKVLLPVVAGVMALALVIPAVAQDATATPDANMTGSTTGAEATAAVGMGTVTCDSSTILLAGLAERYFGYTPTDVTVSNYVYGQYGPLFDMSNMMMPSGEATMEATADMSGAATNPTLAPSTVLLNAPSIAGEDPACTQLRSSLESFFSSHLQSGTADWDSKFNGTGAAG